MMMMEKRRVIHCHVNAPEKYALNIKQQHREKKKKKNTFQVNNAPAGIPIVGERGKKKKTI